MNILQTFNHLIDIICCFLFRKLFLNMEIRTSSLNSWNKHTVPSSSNKYMFLESEKQPYILRRLGWLQNICSLIYSMSWLYMSDDFNWLMFIVLMARMKRVSLFWASLTVPNLPFPNFLPRLKSVIFKPAFLINSGLFYLEVAGGILIPDFYNRIILFSRLVDRFKLFSLLASSLLVEIGAIFNCFMLILVWVLRLEILFVRQVFFFLLCELQFSLFLIATVDSPFFRLSSLSWLMRWLVPALVILDYVANSSGLVYKVSGFYVLQASWMSFLRSVALLFPCMN